MSSAGVDGLSAQRIIGARDAARLARMRDYRCRTREAKIIETLDGDYRIYYLFVAPVPAALEQINQSIAGCDLEIGRRTAAISNDDSRAGRCRPGNTHGPKEQPGHASFEEGWRFYDVGLRDVPGSAPRCSAP